MGQQCVPRVPEGAVVALEQGRHGPLEAPRGAADHVTGPAVGAWGGGAAHAQGGVVQAGGRYAARVGEGGVPALEIVGQRRPAARLSRPCVVVRPGVQHLESVPEIRGGLRTLLLFNASERAFDAAMRPASTSSQHDCARAMGGRRGADWDDCSAEESHRVPGSEACIVGRREKRADLLEGRAEAGGPVAADAESRGALL